MNISTRRPIPILDAENDFVLVNHVVIEQENPGVGQGTDFHGEAIRGNLQLGYTVTIDHGSLIGDLSNVDPTHINSDTSPRTDALYADGSGVTEFRAGASASDGDLLRRRSDRAAQRAVR